MASSVELGSQLETFATALVKGGRYGSRSEILREGVRLIHERETRLAALDASIARGIADADSARTAELDVAETAITAKCRAMTEARSPE